MARSVPRPHPTQYVVVAAEQDAIVGFACAYGSEHDRWGTKLDNLHISPSKKRKGIGTKLLADVASWSSKNYLGKGIFLWVFEQNLPARHFYEHLGGIITGDTLWIAPDGTTVKELLYGWKSAEELIGSARKAFQLGGWRATRNIHVPGTRSEEYPHGR